MKRFLFLMALWTGAWLCSALDVRAQATELQRARERAAKEYLPAGARRIQEETDAKILLEVDPTSYGEDGKAWGNLNITVHRIVSAVLEIGKDQMGKDAIARNMQKVLIVRHASPAQDDFAELKDGTLTVRTTGSDQSGTTLQGVVKAALEKALGLPTNPEKSP